MDPIWNCLIGFIYLIPNLLLLHIAAAESIVAAVGAKFVGDAAGVESVAVAARVESVLFVFYYACCTVHPLGIPLVPVVQDVIDDAFTKVPVEATPFTQSYVQSDTEISVAKHLM